MSDSPGMVVIPCQNTIAVQTVTALMQLQLPPGSSLRPIQEWTSPAEKRNHAISILLATPHLGWAFFCDSDMLPPPDTVRRLLATGCDVVGGLYTGRVFDPQGGGIVYGFECGYVDRDNRPVMPEVVDQLAPVDWVGAGALLVRRHVLEKLAPGPWFGNHGQDDIDFCGAARAAGFSVHVDGRVPVGHLQLVPVMPGASMFLDLNLKSKPL